METIIWPSWMPKPQVSNYSVTPVDSRIVSVTEAGTIIRKQFSTDECECSCSLVLNRLQANFFEAFERDILNQGTSWFEMPLLIAGKVENHVCQFKERPAMKGFVGLSSRYDFTLRVERRKVMSAVSAWALYLFGSDANLSFATQLHEILHVENPRITLVGWESI